MIKVLDRRQGKTTVLILPRKIIEICNLNKTNSVNEARSSRVGALLGKVNHLQHVEPDCHHATVSNKEIIKIGTWNVRTMYQDGRLDTVKQEIDRLKINILGMCETRWVNNGVLLFIFLVGSVKERLWCLYKAPTKEERRKQKAKRREKSGQVY